MKDVVGQRIFKLTVNRNIENNTVFSVNEMRIHRVFNGPLERCELVGKNNEFETVYPDPLFDLMPNEYEVIFGSTFYLTSFEKLDEALEKARLGLLASNSFYLESLQKEVDLLESSVEDYLLSHSNNLDFLLIDLNSLVSNDFENIHIEISYVFREEVGVEFGVFATTVREFSNLEIEDLLEQYPNYFNFDYYEAKSNLNSKKLIEVSRYGFDMPIPQSYTEDTFAPLIDMFSVSKYPNHILDFLAAKHIPFNNTVDKDFLVRQISEFRVRTEPFLRNAFLFHKELNSILSKKNIFEMISQEFLD